MALATKRPPGRGGVAAILAQRSLTLPTLDQERTIAHRLIQRVLRDRSQQAGRLDAVLFAAATVEAAAEHASQRWHERARLAEYAEHANALLTHPPTLPPENRLCNCSDGSCTC
jgi:hypothetical protein